MGDAMKTTTGELSGSFMSSGSFGSFDSSGGGLGDSSGGSSGDGEPSRDAEAAEDRCEPTMRSPGGAAAGPVERHAGPASASVSDERTTGELARSESGAGDSFDGLLRAVARAPSVRPTDIDLVGRTVGRFVVERRLGEGGMGVVYEARDPVLARKVALKVLRASHRRSDATRARLHEEARRVAALHHPNIAAVYDVGEHDGIVFLAMERAAGQSLRARLGSREPLTMPRSLAVLRAVATGLACAHEAGIVHRDLKPENVVVGDDGTVKIIDFGIATSSSKTAPVEGEGAASGRGIVSGERARPAGTRRYMSPEQAAGAAPSARADVYAFGILAREVLAATFVPVRDRGLRAALTKLAGECTALDPDDRPADGAALVARLERITGAGPARRAPLYTVGAAALAAALGVLVARSSHDGAAGDGKGAAGPPTERSPSARAEARREGEPSPLAHYAPRSAVPILHADGDGAAGEPDVEEAAWAGVEDERSGAYLPGEPGRRALAGRREGGAIDDAMGAAADDASSVAGPPMPVTAFVDGRGRLVATVPLGGAGARTAAEVLGSLRGLTADGAEAQVVSDGKGGAVVHVTWRVRPPTEGGGAGSHTFEPGTLPGGDVSARDPEGDALDIDDRTPAKEHATPAHPAHPQDKNEHHQMQKVRLHVVGQPVAIEVAAGPDGQILVIAYATEDAEPEMLAAIDASGQLVDLGENVTECELPARVAIDG